MDKNVDTQEDNFTTINGGRVYIGPERRAERRRQNQNDRVETLLRNFGLDRRMRTDRRRADSSWFLISKKVANQ